jgi:hypothetical protein
MIALEDIDDFEVSGGRLGREGRGLARRKAGGDMLSRPTGYGLLFPLPMAVTVTTVALRMPARSPGSITLVSLLAPVSLGVRIVIVALRMRIIGIVIIGWGVFISIIIFRRIVCIRRAGD